MPQVVIRNRAVPDPICDIPIVDAYMNWAVQAAEEVVGKQGLNILLREVGLERLIGNYPPRQLTASGNFSFADYANLCVGLLTFYGRAGKSMTLRIGRLSAKYGVEQQGQTFGVAALAASKMLPVAMQVRLGLEAMQAGYRVMMPGMKLGVEDRGEKWAYVSETCPMCAGKEATEHICWVFNGVLQEACHWQAGKDFDLEEVACRALGSRACVWEISKKPRE